MKPATNSQPHLDTESILETVSLRGVGLFYTGVVKEKGVCCPFDTGCIVADIASDTLDVLRMLALSTSTFPATAYSKALSKIMFNSVLSPVPSPDHERESKKNQNIPCTAAGAQ